jgi:predicted RNA-binding Zn-ribbon protein involved in translation (DUF1610 family)
MSETPKAYCAHCEDGAPGHSHRRVRCPACEELICSECRKMSTPTDCMHYSDDSALVEVDDEETDHA